MSLQGIALLKIEHLFYRVQLIFLVLLKPSAYYAIFSCACNCNLTI